MSLPGLPPLPKSLSGLELTQQQQQQQNPPPSNNYHSLLQQQQIAPTLNSFDSQRSLTSSSSSSISRKNSTLDTQLAVLRREMVSFIISLFIAVSAENGIETSRIPELDFWYEGLGMLSNATIKN